MNYECVTLSQKRTTLQATLNSAAEKIRAEIAAAGPISFARFMEIALYCPDCGFYEKESDTVGKRGDFYTSVSVGSLFGELLAFQFAEWLPQLSTDHSPLKLVEAGAHDGQLAFDILQWLCARRPELFEKLEFWIVEPSRRRQEIQKKKLSDFAGKAHWAGTMADVGRVRGVIFSNELLDAMPARRFAWDAREQEWFEWGVATEREQFVWRRMEQAGHAQELLESAGFQLQPQLLAVLPDGFTIEVSQAAENWWCGAAGALAQGKLLTMDYGLSANEFLLPERKEGTLRSYHRHRLITDVLANPGEQDITAHVNFTAIQDAGQSDGLRTEIFQTQTKFLTGIAGCAWKPGSNFGQRTPQHTRQFQTLTHADLLGHSFRVLVQSC